MKAITILLAVLFLAVPFTVMGAPKAPSGTAGGYTVNNPNHSQALGGSSTHASTGLSVASQHSPVVVDPPPAGSGSGSGSGGGVPIVTPLS